MIKYFDINAEGCSVRCKYYGGPRGTIRKAVITVHGFAGHKDNKSTERFAEYLLAKHRDTAVLAFDLPCHGSDVRKKLSLADCEHSLSLVTAYAAESLGAEELYAYGNSFGGYLLLKSISEQGNPFERIVLRSPALPMHQVFEASLLTEQQQALLDKGKEILVGFDRKVPVGAAFVEELRAADVTKRDFIPFAEQLLVLHGTGDELVPIAPVQAFCEENIIECIPLEGADHRLRNPRHMDAAVKAAEAFLMRGEL